MDERGSDDARGVATAVAPARTGITDIARRFATYSAYRWLLRITLGVSIAQIFLQWVVMSLVQFIGVPRLYDFSFYYIAALALRENPHADIYNLQVMPAVARAHHLFLGPGQLAYPLLLPILLIPLTLLTFVVAARIWFFFNLLLWMLNTAILIDWLRRGLRGSSTASAGEARGISPTTATAAHVGWLGRLRAAYGSLSDTSRFALVVGLFVALSYGPMIQAQTLGQSSMFILTALLLVPWLVRRGRPEVAGAVLAVVTLVKLFPIVLIVYYASRRQWRVVLGAAVSFVGLFALMFAVVGISGILSMRELLSAASASVLSTFQNESLARAPMWIAIELGGQPGAVTAAIGDMLILVIAVVFALGLFATMRRPLPRAQSEGEHDEALGYSWALCTMILVSPVTWEHYDIWLLPAIMYCMGYVIYRSGDSPRDSAGRVKPIALIGLLIILALVVTFYDLPLGYDGTLSLSLGPFILGHPLRPFFMLLRPSGALLIWVAAGLLFVRPRRWWARRPRLASAGATGQVAPGASSATLPLASEDVSWQRLLSAMLSFLGALVLLRLIVESVVSIGLSAPR